MNYEVVNIDQGFREKCSLMLEKFGLDSKGIDYVQNLCDICDANTHVEQFNPATDSVSKLLGVEQTREDLENFLRTRSPYFRVVTNTLTGKSLCMSYQASFIPNLAGSVTLRYGEQAEVTIPNGILGSLLTSLKYTYNTIREIQDDPAKVQLFLNNNNRAVTAGSCFVDPFGKIVDNGQGQYEKMQDYRKHIPKLLPAFFEAVLPKIVDGNGEKHKTEFYMGIQLLISASLFSRGARLLADAVNYYTSLESEQHRGYNYFGTTLVNPAKIGEYNINLDSFKVQRSKALVAIGIE